MRYITDAKEAKQIDNISINEIGIPSLVLMERAALGVVEEIERYMENCLLMPVLREKQKIIF